MTSPAEPAPTDAAKARQLTGPLRELAAYVLVGANAVLLFVGLIRLLVPTSGYSTGSGRAASAYFSFIGLESTVLPLLAVLLATHLSPALPRAKQITQVAVGEYAFGLLFGVLSFLVWLVSRLAEAELMDAFLGMLTRIAWLALFGIAAFATYRIWRTLYHVPKPAPQPGVYGTPQPGWPTQPGAHPNPAGYPSGQYGQPAPPFGAAPQSAPPFGAPPFGAPQSAPPFAGPNTAPPFGQPPSAEPTQTIPRQPGEAGAPPAPPADTDSDRTQRFHRDDPHPPR